MRILFVCLGNICRSVMAEYILKDILNKNNITNVEVESRATSYEEEGNSIYPEAYDVLLEHGIKVTNHVAKKITKDDYDNFDLIIVMDNNNKLSILRMIGNDTLNKIHLLSEYSNGFYEIEDPWYTRNFNKVYNEIKENVECLYEGVINV